MTCRPGGPLARHSRLCRSDDSLFHQAAGVDAAQAARRPSRFSTRRRIRRFPMAMRSSLYFLCTPIPTATVSKREPYSILVKKSQRLLRRADQRLRDASARLRDADDTADECCRRFGPLARCGDMLYLAHGERRVGCDRRVPCDRRRAVHADSAVGWAHRRSFTCRKRRDGQLDAASPRGR